MSDVNVVQITNTYKRSQPAPTPPENSDFLVHPLVHFPEPPCFTGCIDILNNCCNLVDLFGSIDLDSEGEEVGVSEQALNAFFWQRRLLESSLRYVSLSLRDIQAEQLDQRKKVRSSAFFRGLEAGGDGGSNAGFKELAEGLGIKPAEVVAFMELFRKGTFSDPSA